MSIYITKNEVQKNQIDTDYSSQNDAIQHPHDHFSKKSLKEEAIFRDLLKFFLEAAIYERLDLNTLEVVDPNLEKSNLRAISCDVIYKCDMATPNGAYPCVFIVEHQSRADSLMSLRFLEYTTRLLRYYLDVKTKQLPQVYSVCLYHGTQSPYPHLVHLREELPFPEKATLDFSFQLIDLTQIEIDSLKTIGSASLSLVLLKIARAKNSLAILRQCAQEGMISHLMKHTRADYLASMLTYAIECKEHGQSADELIDIFVSALPQEKNNIMTFRQQLEEKGRVAGRAEGVAEGVAVGRAEGVAAGRVEGVAVGRAEGVAVGRAEGVAVGAAAGKLEGQKEAKVSIAKSMLEAQRFDLQEIMQLTQLTEADLSSLVNTVR